MANTIIQLKWSEVTATPSSLNVAEPAYSNTSGKLFIGLSDNSVVAVGGKYYTDIIDAATSSNTANTLVKRNAQGDFYASNVYAELVGNAATTSKLKVPVTISLNGDANGSVSFDGSQNVTITADLTASGVTPGVYGGTTKIPVFTVDLDGRVTSAANANVATTLSFSGDTQSGTLDLLSDTLNITGGDGITTTANNDSNAIVVDVDNTVIRTSGGQTINGSLAITGDLVITGNIITQDVSTIVTEDSLIKLAANNVADALDIGFFGEYTSSGTKYAAFFRDASDTGKFKLLVDGTEQPSAGNTVNAAAFTVGTLVANIVGGTIGSLAQPIAIVDGGTNNNTFDTGKLIHFDGTKLISLANTNTAGVYANASHVPVITTDSLGRVTGVVNTKIDIDTSQVTSGILPIVRGGSNNNTFTTGSIVFYDGEKMSSFANTGTAGTYSYANSTPAITTDAYGRVSGITPTLIQLDTSQIISGTLPIVRGGTGASSFAVKGVIVSDTSSTTGALSALTSATEGHVLQINSSGVPVFGTLTGGSF